MKNRPSPGGTAGFSLIEMLIVTTLLFLVLGSVTMVSNANNRAYRTGITNAHLEAQAGIVIGRVVSELSSAEESTLFPSPTVGAANTSLAYHQARGFVNGQVVWSPDRQLAFEYEPGELDDGLDNNGNGLVDEGRIVLIEDLNGPNERKLVVTRWVSELLEGEFPNGLDDNGNGMVDEKGFCVERTPDGTASGNESLLVRVTLARRDESGRLLRRSAQTSVRIRN